MLGFKAIRTKRPRMLGRALLAGAAAVFVPVLAHAHFVLVAPDAWMSQDDFGLPEKLGPCGDEGGGTPTGKVTVFQPGQTIAVTVNEVIPHPGHYRVALAVNNRSELPQEPLVTPIGNDPCGSAAIQSPPTFPVLADNILPHMQAFGAPQTFAVTLPTDVTCAKCTLQVLEFMSNHSAPCFYHHCADISIQGAPTPSPTQTDTSTPVPTNTPTSLPADTPTSTHTVTATESNTATGTPTVIATPIPTATPTETPIPAPICAGDCNGDGQVTVDELVTIVNIALDRLPVDDCLRGDPNHTGQVAVNGVIAAANNALTGCSGS